MMKRISQHPVSSKHVPQRTCVACHKVKNRWELIRLVRVFAESVEVDTGGKRVGRGAYLCRSRECWQIGLKGSRLERALRTTLTQDNREQLIRYGEDLGADG